MEDVQLDDGMMLVTCDIESLYTTIKHADGLKTTHFFFTTSDLDADFGEFGIFFFAVKHFTRIHKGLRWGPSSAPS